MSAHTRGQWRRKGAYIEAPYGDSWIIIATVVQAEESFGAILPVEAEANEKLIAATPEMWELIRDLWGALDSCQPIPGNGSHDPETLRTLFARCHSLAEKTGGVS